MLFPKSCFTQSCFAHNVWQILFDKICSVNTLLVKSMFYKKRVDNIQLCKHLVWQNLVQQNIVCGNHVWQHRVGHKVVWQHRVWQSRVWQHFLILFDESWFDGIRFVQKMVSLNNGSQNCVGWSLDWNKSIVKILFGNIVLDPILFRKIDFSKSTCDKL